MLSESQERMLLLVKQGREAAVAAHFARWDLHAEVIGRVTDDQQIRVQDGPETVADLPIALLTDEVPAYDLSPVAPSIPIHGSPAGRADNHVEHDSARLGAALLALLGSPNLRSRRFAFRQYDSTVQGNTVFGPGQGAAAVVRVEGTGKGLALTTDCNPRFMLLDPHRGAQQAVAEAARNLACVGATPIAVTDCLNFGNPEKPTVAWQLTEAIHGLAAACQALEVPIVSGNVSLYNETAGRPIPPTPAVGMVGLIEDVSLAVALAFQAESAVVVLGNAPTTLSAGEYAAESGAFPSFDIADERRLGDLLRALAAQRVLRSAQDVSDGGLAVTLAECALAGNVGARVTLTPASEAALFSEDQARAVVTCAPEHVAEVLAMAAQHSVPAQSVGHTGGDRLVVDQALDLPLSDLRRASEDSVS
jgi:phosphoribosylformylglycinamidine synthase